MIRYTIGLDVSLVLKDVEMKLNINVFKCSSIVENIC
jgi:hypothetical protein